MPSAAARRSDALRRAVRARYDAAQTSDNNRRHWANADLLSADAAGNPGVRARLRSRCRYEVHESNSFANGIVKTLANYLIGPGPRLKMRARAPQAGGTEAGVDDGRGAIEDRRLGRDVQRSWAKWCKKVKLASKLRTMRMAKATDGEAVAVLTTNPRLDHPVKLDVQLLEADQLTTPTLTGLERDRVDGIDLDRHGNALRYHFLKDHPGGDTGASNPLETDTVDGSYVIHWFRQDRPGQHRGVPELAPALPLFALVRRYVLAVLGAAETAAEFAGVMYSDGPAVETDTSVEAMDAIELEMRAMLTLPQGWKLGQVKAEQPTTTFQMFRDALWNETARCVLMPMNIASGNSAGYNFASGRLDHQAFDLAIDTERAECVDEVLDRIFEAWLREYLSERSGIAPSDIDLSLYDWHWYWPPREHVDPLKQASADEKLWNLGQLSDDDLQFSRGVDPLDHYEAIERQQERRRALGLPLPGGPRQASNQDPDAAPEPDDEPQADDATADERELEEATA